MADEHFIPGTSRITEIESFHRYCVAAELCRDCRVLDAASGDGYGSAILASKAAQVTGIDLNQQAAGEASQKYFAENLTFVNGDVAAMPFEDNSFDRVVSFETIEHIPDQKKFLQEVRRVLSPGGVLILSSPNRTPFRTRNGSENAYHINELESDELRELLSGYFPNIRFYAQDAFYNSVITGDGEFSYYVKNQYNRIVRQESLDQVQYSIVIASEKKLPALTPSCYLDASFDPERGYVLDDEAVVHQFGLRGEFEKVYRNFTELQQNYQLLDNEKNDCVRQNREFSGTIESLQQLNEQLKNENSVHVSRNEELTGAVNSISKAAESAQQLNQQLVEDRNAGISERDELRRTNETLRLQNWQLTAEVDLKASENGGLQQLLDAANEEKRQLADEVSLKAAENGGLQELLDAADAEKRQLTAEVDLKASENGGLQGLLDAANKENRQLADEISLKAAENGGLQRLLDDANKENRQLTELCRVKTVENGGLQQLLDAVRAEKRQLAEEFSLLTEEHCGLRQHIESLKGLNQELEEKCRAKEFEISEYRRKTKEMNETNQNLANGINANRDKIQQLGQQLEQLAHDLAEAHRIIALKDEERKTFESQIEALKNNCASADAKINELSGQLTHINTEIANRDAAIKSLRDSYNEEHAKAEYLYHEYLELKNSFTFKMLGRFRLGDKAMDALCHTAECAHSVGHKVLKALPGNYSSKMTVRNKFYSCFGGLLGNVENYRLWHKHYVGLKALEMEGESGLIMPKDVPMTSIIIPVYNNIELTKRCLHSIYNIGTRSPFEVVIVDDCSTDDYASLKKDFPEVRVIRNEKNSGFLLTVNRGAKEAKGEYILILNNDTEVVPGWLDELTTALYKHPEAGMIGSALIHLNTGTLQESGNLICKNGDMMPLGRGESPDHPRFTYFREVDFCSAASIIMRKKVFEEMDGFDRIYVPAYFEDPDLGLRLKKAGYKNYVCPLSRVLHQEMASYGDALDDKCAKNRGIFMERWGRYLEENALYRDRNEPNECMKFPRPRIMYIDAETPMADRGSGGMDAIFFMEYMIKRGYDVVFHGEYTPGYVPKYTTILLRMGVECVYEPYRKIWEYLESSGWTFTHIFVSRIYQARCFDWLFKRYCPNAAYIFDTVDVHFVREQLEADLKDDDDLRKLAAETKQYELAVAQAADATIVISSDEKKLLENDYKLTNVYHIPQARELFGLAPNPNRRGAVFIGSAHPPNMDGLRYFHDEILPLLPRDFKLTIIGEALKMMMSKTEEYKDLLKCPQYKFVGFVEDLGDELNNAMITVAPLRYGAGTKGKVASSMSYGVPCVSSSFGTEGTGMVHGENIMIAKTPQEFADYIRQLFEDQELWKRISDGSIKFIKDNYAPEAVEKMMDDLFADVDKRVREKRSFWSTTPVVPKVD